MKIDGKWEFQRRRHPIVEGAVAVFSFVIGLTLLTIAATVTILALLILPPLHFVFRLLGRTGFHSDNDWLIIGRESFERRSK